MITLGDVRLDGHKVSNCIYFHDSDCERIIYWLSRSINTMSPVDKTLLEILDEVKKINGKL